MRGVFSWLVIGTVVLGLPVVAACGSEDETHYGPPGGLRGTTFPTATATTPPPDSGGPPPTDGGVITPVDGGTTQTDGAINPAAKTFTKDIYPMMLTSGVWKCTTVGCHVNGSNPAIDPNSAANAYAQLVAYKLVANPPGMQYVVPGTTDATKSAFDCNLKGTCGQGQMPQGNPATAADIATVDAWLAAGAPQ